MNWNYRLVNLAHENGGAPWVDICEVFYRDDGTPIGYSPACIGSETVHGVRDALRRMAQVLELPVLDPQDFHRDDEE